MEIKLMKKIILTTAVAAIVPLLISGCSSRAKYVETGGRENIVTIGDVNIQDFIVAAESASQKLLGSGTLDRVPHPPAIIAISRVVNSTSQHLDTDLLTRRIRVKLNESGKAITTTTIGLGGVAEDPLAKDLQSENGEQSILPDYTLSGKIIETAVRAGKTRQSTYSFYLALTDRRGLALWEGEEEITKQGKKPSVGF